ncbi:MAG: hypothetical protein WHX60_07050 [Armatimonadota bacterium]
MDYMDADVAYLSGLIVARGTLTEAPAVRQVVIDFPYSTLKLQGNDAEYDQETEILLGLHTIRKRLVDLLEADVETISGSTSATLTIRFLRNSMAWRNILLLLDNKLSYAHFQVPSVFFDPQIPKDWKIQFVRGYADVAGNIRHANRYVDGRHRVRLDVLNSPANWQLPVQLCTLLQEQIGVPVQLINWGHPNMGRAFREHQINIFAEAFLPIGFSFRHKQHLLEQFAQRDRQRFPNIGYNPCPGVRRVRREKPPADEEQDTQHLPPPLQGRHFNAYFEICRALGCQRYVRDDREAERFTDEVEAGIDEEQTG